MKFKSSAPYRRPFRSVQSQSSPTKNHQNTMNTTTTETESELKSSILPAKDSKAPARITLKRGAGPGEWITRQENVHNGAEFSAHYFAPIGSLGGEAGAYKRALRNYTKRCMELGVVANGGAQ